MQIFEQYHLLKLVMLLLENSRISSQNSRFKLSSSHMRADVSAAKKIMTRICVPETQKFLSPASGRSSSPHQQLRHVVSTGWNVPDFTSQWMLEPRPQRDGGLTGAVTWE